MMPVSTDSQRTILLIDDNPEDRLIFRRFLTRGGRQRYHIEEARAVPEAMQMVWSKRPDCIIVDHSMTHGTGITFLRELAATGLAIPVIMLTGTGNVTVAVEALKTGARDYLAKGDITQETLCRAVENVLAQHDLEQRLVAQQTREQEARDAASRSAERLALALDAAGQAFYDWEADTRQAIWSDRLPALLGVREENFQGSPRQMMRRIHPADRPHICALVRSALRERGPFQAEFRVRGADDTWLAVSGRVFGQEDGSVERVTGVLWDITERRRSEEALADAARRQARIAETLQRAMLLPPSFEAFADLDLAMRYEPAWDEAQIGGDFFDAFAVNEQTVALIVGDVTGKGLVAAAYTAEVKFGLRALIRSGIELAAALERMNTLLLDARRFDGRPHNALVAVAAVLMNRETGETICASAGAEPPLIVRRPAKRGDLPETEEIAVRGVLLGALAEGGFSTVTRTIHPGDTFLLTTDGLTEAREPNRGRFFGYEGLTEAARVALAASEVDLEVVADSITEQAKTFAGGKLSDDLCLLLARRR